MKNSLILKESELVKLIISTIKDAHRQIQEQTIENIPLGTGNRGWTYQDGATYFWSNPTREWVVSFLGGPDAGDYGGYVPNDGRSYGDYSNYDDFRKNYIYNTGNEQNPNFSEEKKRLLAWRSSVEFNRKHSHKCEAYWDSPAFDDMKGFEPIHYYIHNYGPSGMLTVDMDNPTLTTSPTFIDNIRKWSKNPEYSLLNQPNISTNPCDYVELFGLDHFVDRCKKDYNQYNAFQKDNSAYYSMNDEIEKKLSKVSGNQQVSDFPGIESNFEAPLTTQLSNIKFLSYVQCLDNVAKQTLPKSTGYNFDIPTASYTEVAVDEPITKDEPVQFDYKFTDKSTDSPSMNLIPVKSLEGVDLEVPEDVLKHMEVFIEKALGGLPPVSGSLPIPAEVIPYLESIMNAGTKVWNKFIDGLDWIIDYCEEQGWYCVEIVASTIGLVLFGFTLVFGTSILLEGAILFAGAVTVKALWEQGKKGMALVIGGLEAFGVFKWLKMLKMNDLLKSDDVIVPVLKHFENPSTKSYRLLDPNSRKVVDYVKRNPRTSINLLKNQKEVRKNLLLMNKIKDWKQFNLLTKTKEWQKIPSLKHIKTWDDFVKFRDAAMETYKYSFKIQRGINTTVSLFKWSAGIGLVGAGAYFTYARMVRIFGENRLKGWEEHIRNNHSPYPVFDWDKEKDRRCMLEGYIMMLNNGCNPEWDTFLEQAAGRYVEEDTNEAKWQWLINDMMARKDTESISDIYSEIDATLQQFVDGNEKCFEGQDLMTYVRQCSGAPLSTDLEDIDYHTIASELLKVFGGTLGKTDEVTFWKITYNLNPKQKIKVRKALKYEFGECLCDLIEADFQFQFEVEALEAWDMYEEGTLRNCTCID